MIRYLHYQSFLRFPFKRSNLYGVKLATSIKDSACNIKFSADTSFSITIGGYRHFFLYRELNCRSTFVELYTIFSYYNSHPYIKYCYLLGNNILAQMIINSNILMPCLLLCTLKMRGTYCPRLEALIQSLQPKPFQFRLQLLRHSRSLLYLLHNLLRRRLLPHT